MNGSRKCFSEAYDLTILLVLAGVIALARLRTYDAPLEEDISTYAVIAHEMLRGRPLYADLWDHKPPAVHITYAGAEVLWGYGPRSIYFLGVTAAVLTLHGVYIAARVHPWGRAAGLWAAAFWTVLSGDLRLQGYQPNTEVFINACLIGAFALFARADAQPWRVRQALLVGVLLALASLYKQVVVGSALLLACAHLAVGPHVFPPWRQAFAHMVVVLLVGVLAWASIFVYFWARGHFRDFYDAVFTYNRFYAGNLATNIYMGLERDFSWILFVGSLLAIAASVYMARSSASVRLWALLAAYALGTFLAVHLPGKSYPHYYQLWLPVFVVGGAYVLGSLSETLGQFTGWLSHGMAGLIFVWLLLFELPNYLLPATQWSFQDGRRLGLAFTEPQLVAQKVNEILLPGEMIYVWGTETGLYYAIRRPPPTGVLYNFPLLQGPLVKTLSKRVIADLDSAQPELVVRGRMSGGLNWPRDHPVYCWWSERYWPLPGACEEPFTLYVRRGGRLDKHLVSVRP